MFYIGTILDIIVFGNFALLIKNYNHLPILKKKKINEISLYLDSLEINKQLGNEIEEYNEALWWNDRKKFLDSSLLKDLNDILKVRLSILEFKDKLFSVCDFLDNFSESFFIKFTKNLKSRFSHINDILIFEGDIEKKVYFIPKLGTVLIKVNGNVIKRMKQGEFFGEISSFLKSGRRTATVISLSITNFLYIEQNSFKKMLYDFPNEAKYFYKVAISRFKNSVDLINVDLKNRLGYIADDGIFRNDFFNIVRKNLRIDFHENINKKKEKLNKDGTYFTFKNSKKNEFSENNTNNNVSISSFRDSGKYDRTNVERNYPSKNNREDLNYQQNKTHDSSEDKNSNKFDSVKDLEIINNNSFNENNSFNKQNFGDEIVEHPNYLNKENKKVISETTKSGFFNKNFKPYHIGKINNKNESEIYTKDVNLTGHFNFFQTNHEGKSHMKENYYKSDKRNKHVDFNITDSIWDEDLLCLINNLKNN